MIQKQFVSLLLIASLSIISCGGNDKKDGDEKMTTTTDNKEATDKSTAEAGDASACGETAVTFAADKITSDGFTVKYAQATLWEMASGDIKYPSVNIQISNYEREGSYLQSPVKDGDTRLIISVNGKTGEKITTGVYDMSVAGFGAGNNVSGGIETKEKNSGFNNGSGILTVTYISDSKICGTIDVKGSGDTFIKGTFSCPLEKSAY